MTIKNVKENYIDVEAGPQDGRITHVSDVRRVNKQLNYVLEYVVERKRVDDLAASIRDQRFRKQKAAMTRCGARCLLYLIEGLPESTCYTLCRTTFSRTNAESCNDLVSSRGHN